MADFFVLFGLHLLLLLVGRLLANPPAKPHNTYASGTNDKAGGLWNLIRWTSPRAIKNTFVPAAAYGYPFLAKD